MRFALALLVSIPLLAQDDQDPQPPDPGDSGLESLAKKAGRDVKWVKGLEAALAESKSSGRLVFGYVYDRDRSQRFGNAFKDHFMMAGPLNDTDLVWTLNRKFVPTRIYLDKEACDLLQVPTPDGKARKLLLSDVVVPGVLFLDGEGKVVFKFDKIASASSELLFHACHNVLEKNKSFDLPSRALESVREEHQAAPDDLRVHYRLGLELVKDAEFEAAKKTFEAVIAKDGKSREAVESAYRIAGVCRRLRDADGAIAALQRARELNADGLAKIEGDLALEEALLSVKRAQFAGALKQLTDAVEKFPKSNRVPEMRFYVGAMHWLLDEEQKAKDVWKDVANKHPQSPFAYKSAAEALERGPLANGWEILEWLPADFLTGDPASTERRRKPEEYDAVVKGGIDYLLRQQKPDGRWTNIKGQFDFKEAITALAARALYETRDAASEPGADARRKATAYFETWMERKVAGQGMNMWPWIVGTHLYARLAMDVEGDAKAPLLAKIATCVEMLKKAQNKDGCWTYAGADPSTFSTGGALVALWEAKQAGADIEDAMIERAFKGMAKLKTEKGTYQYSSIRETDEFDPTDPRGASGRGAPCYLAEFLWKKCDLAQLERALDDFVKYRKHLKAVRKATDWHAGKYANAPYFFFYDYFYAAMATQHLADEKRPGVRTALRDDMLEICEVDGSWLDWHIGGKSYGTAMAVMILRYCGKP